MKGYRIITDDWHDSWKNCYSPQTNNNADKSIGNVRPCKLKVSCFILTTKTPQKSFDASTIDRSLHSCIKGVGKQGGELRSGTKNKTKWQSVNKHFIRNCLQNV